MSTKPDQAHEGLIDASPCILGRAQLPQIVDADPEWRAKAQYTREELVSLVSATSIPEHERVANALLGLAALRVGEMGGLHFRNVTLEMSPLGRIVVARSYNKRGTKTKVVRWMPIHPVLGEILREWQGHGFEATMGRAPMPDDLVVPTPPKPKGKGRFSAPWRMRDKNFTRKCFLRDLRTLGIDHRRVHDLRRTFISLAREDGADKDILRRGTHQPPKDVMELYTTVEWKKLCAEVAKLRISLVNPPEKAPTPAEGLGAGLGAVKDKTPQHRGVEWWRRRESKLTYGEHATARRGTTFGGNAFIGGRFRFLATSTADNAGRRQASWDLEASWRRTHPSGSPQDPRTALPFSRPVSMRTSASNGPRRWLCRARDGKSSTAFATDAFTRAATPSSHTWP